MVFKLGVEDKSRIKGWKLQVMDSNKKVIKEFKMSERDTIKGLTVKGFFKRLISKKESLVVPDKIMWAKCHPLKHIPLTLPPSFRPHHSARAILPAIILPTPDPGPWFAV